MKLFHPHSQRWGRITAWKRRYIVSAIVKTDRLCAGRRRRSVRFPSHGHVED